MATARCTWTAVSGVDGYNVYLKSNGTFVKQNSELITETVYDIENLEDGNYEAYATSVLNSVESDASNVKGFEVGPVSGDLFTDFSEYTEDEFPSDWVNINNASNWVVTSGILTSGLTSDNDRANWDVGEGALSDIEVLAKMRTSNNASTNRLRVFARSNMGEGFTTAGVDTYYAGLRAGTRVEIAKLVNGSFSQVASNLSFSYLANTWYWMRFRLEGTSLKVKVWADGETEPEAWTVETTDSSHSSGYVGFGGAAHKHEFDSLNIEDISA